MENGRIPRCRPGRFLLPKQARTAGSLVSDETEETGRAPRTRTGLRGLANHWLDDFAVRTFFVRVKQNEMVPSAGSAPAPPRSQRGMLLLHYVGSVE